MEQVRMQHRIVTTLHRAFLALLGASAPPRFSVLIACLAFASATFADDRMEKLPGYERYKLVTDNMDKLATGGRITRWAAGELGTIGCVGPENG